MTFIQRHEASQCLDNRRSGSNHCPACVDPVPLLLQQRGACGRPAAFLPLDGSFCVLCKRPVVLRVRTTTSWVDNNTMSRALCHDMRLVVVFKLGCALVFFKKQKKREDGLDT